MAPALTLSLFAQTLFFKVALILGDFVSAEVGHSVNFTATCADADFKLTTQDNSRTVARLVNGVWTPGEHYRDRVQHHSASCIGLTDVNYNDEGLFEFFCGRTAVTLIQLEVVAPLEVSAMEGDRVRLQCHSSTAGPSAKPVRWEKDGALLLELDPSSEETGHLPPDWQLKGDVSVTLDRVKPEDRGDYLCHARDKEGRRRLVAWRVRVKERDPDETTCPPPPECPQKGVETGIIVCVTAAVTTCLLAAVFWCVWRLKQHGPNGPPGPETEGASETGHKLVTGPAGSHANEGP